MADAFEQRHASVAVRLAMHQPLVAAQAHELGQKQGIDGVPVALLVLGQGSALRGENRRCHDASLYTLHGHRTPTPGLQHDKIKV